MNTVNKIKWSIEADFLQGCNCNYGCPCEFEAPPTYGHCEGMGAWKITKGRYGDVSLDGLGFAFAAHWPKAIHLGNGTAVLFFDEKANAKQREALMDIATGKAGGMPFEIIVTTFSKVLDPQFVPFKFTMKGNNSSVQVGNAIFLTLEPIKNPVTGNSESVRIEHATGFIFQSAEALSTKDCRINVGELNFSCVNRSGFLSKIKYGN